MATNQDYFIKPSPSSIYTINGGIGRENFHGSGWTDGSAIGAGQIRLGGLIVLVWHHQADGTAIPQIISFPPGKDYAYANVGPHGGSIHFLIGDVPGTYADNAGICEVDVILDDESGVIRPVYPIVAEDNHVHKGYAKWTVGDTGFVVAGLQGTYSGFFGSAVFSTFLILVNKLGSPIYSTSTRTLSVGADNIDGTNTKNATFVDFPPVPPEILKTARGAIVDLKRDAGLGSALDWIEEVAENFQRLDKVYKTLKNLEIVKDIALAVAAV